MNLRDLIKVLEIVAKYDESSQTWCQAEHDILFLPLMNDTEIDSVDHANLLMLGAFKHDDGGWAVYT